MGKFNKLDDNFNDMVGIIKQEIKKVKCSLFGEGYHLKVDFDEDILNFSNKRFSSVYADALNNIPAKTIKERVTPDCPHFCRYYVTMWFSKEGDAQKAYTRLEKVVKEIN